MDPLTLGLTLGSAAIGLGMQLFGGAKSADVSRQEANVSSDVATQEQGINVQKQTQQTLQANRMQIENYRNAQRQRALGENASVNQGSSVGTGFQSSGYAGGQAGVTDMANWNSRNINQNSQISQNIFGLTSNINSDKSQLAQLGGQAATDQGIASMGGSILGASGIFGKIGGSLFGGSSGGSGNPGSNSMWPNITGGIY